MQRRKCIGCGHLIFKTSYSDPYLCRDCGNLMINGDERYAHLDKV
jgi:predicted RNA-binding Zn-ribbon protein involved in translation (DUF1610 family)